MKIRAIKPRIMWAVADDNGFIWSTSVQRTRKESIAIMETELRAPWDWMKRHYHTRLVKVSVQAVDEKGGV